MTLRLDRFDRLPAALADIAPRAIRSVFPNPALVALRGKHERPLFVSTLLHGNETTSFFVLRELARRYADTPPPRSMLIFIGNVEAAEAGARVLDGQPDFNRIWTGGEGPYHALVGEVLAAARVTNPFASIDIHNNSGANPYYGCVNALRPADLHLASLFSEIGVYYQNPPTTQSIAFSHLCPAVTVECGQSGDETGIARAVDLVEAALRLERFPDRPPEASAQRLYETVGAMHIDASASFAFGEDGKGREADLVLRGDIESLNFADLDAGALWAIAERRPGALTVVDEHGVDLTARFFRREGDALMLREAATPAMITHDEAIVRQDCLGYLMRRL
jgi:hypothetical protein